MASKIATTWTCAHCNFINARPDMRGRVIEEFCCAKCGNAGPGAIPAGTFDATGSILTADADTLEFQAEGKLKSITCADFANTGTGTAIITLDGPAKAGGLEVTLTSGTPAKMTIPATATVLEGNTSVSVVVTGVAAGTSLLTAAATGSVNKTVTATAT
jgi:hypothetical protein